MHPYAKYAETVFVIHLIWTILSPLQIVFLLIFEAAYIPYFCAFVFINVAAPLIFRGCPVTQLEKYLRSKAGQSFDTKLTFMQYLTKRFFGTPLPRSIVHLIHGTGYAISILIIWFKILN